RSLKACRHAARPPTHKRARCALPSVLEGGLKLVPGRADQQRVNLRFAPPAGSLTIDADAGQLRQVVVNLLLNALDAMPAGGAVEGVAPADEAPVEFAGHDTRAGIPAQVPPPPFPPVATGKETGLGLGLVVSKRIVEDHGGTLRGFNRPDNSGATFVVRLPRAA